MSVPFVLCWVSLSASGHSFSRPYVAVCFFVHGEQLGFVEFTSSFVGSILATLPETGAEDCVERTQRTLKCCLQLETQRNKARAWVWIRRGMLWRWVSQLKEKLTTSPCRWKSPGAKNTIILMAQMPVEKNEVKVKMKSSESEGPSYSG